MISPAQHPQKSSQHVRGCGAVTQRSLYRDLFNQNEAMAQFVLKIEKLSHIMVSTPILEMARAYDLRPRLWLLPLVYPYVTSPGRESTFKPPKCLSFLFVFIAFHDFYNVFCCLKYNFQT